MLPTFESLRSDLCGDTTLYSLADLSAGTFSSAKFSTKTDAADVELIVSTVHKCKPAILV